jgi:hypothetical protein
MSFPCSMNHITNASHPRFMAQIHQQKAKRVERHGNICAMIDISSCHGRVPFFMNCQRRLSRVGREREKSLPSDFIGFKLLRLLLISVFGSHKHEEREPSGRSIREGANRMFSYSISPRFEIYSNTSRVEGHFR